MKRLKLALFLILSVLLGLLYTPKLQAVSVSYGCGDLVRTLDPLGVGEFHTICAPVTSVWIKARCSTQQ